MSYKAPAMGRSHFGQRIPVRRVDEFNKEYSRA